MAQLVPNPQPRKAEPPPVRKGSRRFHLAIAGSPNTGKTTLFNALTGLRAKTANFPGTTVEHRTGPMVINGEAIQIIDLPGIYSLSAATPEEKVTGDVLLGRIPQMEKPDAVLIIADATNLERSLFLISQLFEHEVPVLVGLNMMDVAEHRGIHVDPNKLSLELGCTVVPMAARSGRGIEDLKVQIQRLFELNRAGSLALTPPPVHDCNACGGCPFQARYSWSDQIASRVVKAPRVAPGGWTERLDKLLTHPVVGVTSFLLVMLSVFYLIFSVASVPMDLIDGWFSQLAAWVALRMPEGLWRSLVVDGIIGGVGGIMVFLPQICILFFFLALLEDSGYLARAAFVMDRLMRRIGLPGTAFVPLLSAHACAIPAIMATRVIQDKRDRLVTILVAPLMTCSARIPVYAMVAALLFPARPDLAALVFVGAYSLGIFAALTMAFVFKKTILPGETKPLVLELPSFRLPSLRTSLLYTLDRARVFVTKAGTVILAISVSLWALATFPQSAPLNEAVELAAQGEALVAAGAVEEGEAMMIDADNLANRHQLSNSIAGRLGKLIEPVVRPLGFDWQIGIGIISSFAAREAVVSTLAIVYGMGADAAEDGSNALYERMQAARRPDGSPVFTMATCISLLVFYVLAMQCLPTQAVTRRETNSWRWPLFQLGYMTLLAYSASFLAYNLVQLLQ